MYFFGSISSWVTNECNYWIGAPAVIPDADSADWTLCANEGDDCTGLDPHAAQWVRYGDESNGVHRYHYRLVVAQNDGIPCRDELFHDPDTAHKFCWRAPADYTFTDLAGHWKQLTRCE